jgi:putative peptide zinc metalloprotease protein
LPDWPRGQGTFIRAYGWAAFVWRVFVCLSLTVTAATLLHGAGIVLACVAVVLWLGLPALHFAQYFVFGKPGEQPRRIRFLLTVGSIAATGVIVFGFVPWPGTCGAPAIVEYAPHTVVRAASAGFVKEVHVESSQQVETGQLLVVLENRQLARDVADLELQLRQSELRGRQHEQKGELAAQQAEAKEREALEIQLAEKRAQFDELTVHAPSAGKTICQNLSALIGTYLQEGDEIVSLGDEAKKELRLSVSQDDLDVFAQRVGKPVCVDVSRHALWHSQLAKVIPRATLSPTHPALAAANGGPLPVKPVAQPKDGSDAHELLAPRFTGIVSLSQSEARQLHAGERADVRYRPLGQSIGQHLCDVSSRWIRQRLTP